jgi:hypothetical protein
MDIYSKETKSQQKMTPLIKWVSDCCLTPAQQFFSYISYIMAREQVNFQWDDDEVLFVLDQHA